MIGSSPIRYKKHVSQGQLQVKVFEKPSTRIMSRKVASTDQISDIYGKENELYGKGNEIYGKENEIYGKENELYGKENDIDTSGKGTGRKDDGSLAAPTLHSNLYVVSLVIMFLLAQMI